MYFICSITSKGKKIAGLDIWLNLKAFSPRFCRPITIQWTRECSEMILAEEKKILDEIGNLSIRHISSYIIEFKLLITMVDGTIHRTLITVHDRHLSY